MTRKLTRRTSVLRGTARLIAVLTAMIALGALAQTRGTGQPPAKSHDAPVPNAVSHLQAPEGSPLLVMGNSEPVHVGRLEQTEMVPPPPVSFKPAVVYYSGGGEPLS